MRHIVKIDKNGGIVEAKDVKDNYKKGADEHEINISAIQHGGDNYNIGTGVFTKQTKTRADISVDDFISLFEQNELANIIDAATRNKELKGFLFLVENKRSVNMSSPKLLLAANLLQMTGLISRMTYAKLIKQ